MKSRPALSLVMSLFAALCYLLFALLAFSYYPLPYSPLNNWLSDLGNPDLNPDGAIFYNSGIVATGALLLVFFLGLSVWTMETNRLQRMMLYLTQGLGGLGALAMVMSGLFPLSHFALHSFFSACLYILLGTAFAFSVAALRYHAACPRWVLVVGALTALVDMTYGVFHSVFILEWVTVALLLCSLCILGIETNRFSAHMWERVPPTPAS